MTIRLHTAGAVAEAVNHYLPELLADKFASRLFAKDAALWGESAADEAAIRLGWTNCASDSIQMIPEIVALRDELRTAGIDRIVLCGMGGSSLAPEVITATAGVSLVVLDSTHPLQVSSVINNDIERTAVVVSSKSGSTVETDSQKRSFEEAFELAGIDKTKRIIIVTDPESPMEKQALIDGYRVFRADPTVGGRYSALTAFGVVPSTLAGVDMRPILQSAVKASQELALDSEANPGLRLGIAMAMTKGGIGLKDKLGLVPEGSPNVGLGDWLEQLIAESTGKEGLGVLPVVLTDHSPELKLDLDDLLLIGLSSDANNSQYDLAVSGDLGEQFLLWQVATAVCSKLLGINPFDQPDVESAKVAARALLESPISANSYQALESGVSANAIGFDLKASNLKSAISQLTAELRGDGYLAIQVYGDRYSNAKLIVLREILAAAAARPVTFGWGPRFLHSTGQYHKGGPKQGVFLQLMDDQPFDLAIPGRPFGYRQLITSQAEGDAKVLAENGLRVLALKFDDLSRALGLLVSVLS